MVPRAAHDTYNDEQEYEQYDDNAEEYDDEYDRDGYEEGYEVYDDSVIIPYLTYMVVTSTCKIMIMAMTHPMMMTGCQ